MKDRTSSNAGHGKVEDSLPLLYMILCGHDHDHDQEPSTIFE